MLQLRIVCQFDLGLVCINRPKGPFFWMVLTRYNPDQQTNCASIQ